MSNKNMLLWEGEGISKTNPLMTKKAKKGGYQFTSIDAYSLIKKATAQWGPYGTWGLFNIQYHDPLIIGDSVLVRITSTFRYPLGSKSIEFPISNSILISYRTKDGKRLIVDPEFTKKLETNTISKALSRLGFGADVFMGRFDDDRYLKTLGDEFSALEQVKAKEENDEQKMTNYINKATTLKQLTIGGIEKKIGSLSPIIRKLYDLRLEDAVRKEVPNLNKQQIDELRDILSYIINDDHVLWGIIEKKIKKS